MAYAEKYDVIVIGGGHAGIEASLAPARMGFNVLLLTLNLDRIGQMSCNPAVGGLAKGHLVKEIDVLGGELGVLADKTAIQYRMLNRSKGPAVWSPRTQNDRQHYQEAARKTLDKEARIVVKQEEVVKILIEKNKVIGVSTGIGNEYHAHSVILTTGTFLNGLMHIGLESFPGGRLAEPGASQLSNSLRKLGLNLGRLKTGTSPRVAKNSVNVADLRIQLGDEEPKPFSFRTQDLNLQQMPCYITHTNEQTHRIIRENLDRSPLYTGKIIGIGPRYCPSIETKVFRFANRDSHLVFIEPEGVDAGEVYLNGLSTSLPCDVQLEILHSIEGLENADITKPGYAVEYDFVYPVQLCPTLETKVIENLFCAGQINGTSGYEEAAAQGLIAGINAALKIRDEKPLILKRYEAYIGVLIDDLVTRNTLEPYRMFTSLAEHRLILRIDNVADRLMPYGVKYGLIEETQHQKFVQERDEINSAIESLKRTIAKPEIANPVLLEKKEAAIPEERGGQSLYQILKRPNIHFEDIEKINGIRLEKNIGTRLEIEVKYDGYIKREEELIQNLRQLERERIPDNFDYQNIRGLSNEAKSKLSEVRPANLDQASRIQGISPTDTLVLLLHLRKGN